MVGGLGRLGDDVKSIDGDIGGGSNDDDDDDDLGKKHAMELEEWTVDCVMCFFLGGIVKDVRTCGCGQ